MPLRGILVHFGAYREIVHRACIHADLLVLQMATLTGLISANGLTLRAITG